MWLHATYITHVGISISMWVWYCPTTQHSFWGFLVGTKLFSHQDTILQDQCKNLYKHVTCWFILTQRPDHFEWAIFYCSFVKMWWGSYLFWLTPRCIWMDDRPQLLLITPNKTRFFMMVTIWVIAKTFQLKRKITEKSVGFWLPCRIIWEMSWPIVLGGGGPENLKIFQNSPLDGFFCFMMTRDQNFHMRGAKTWQFHESPSYPKNVR